MKLKITTSDPLGILESTRTVMNAAHRVHLIEPIPKDVLAELASRIRGSEHSASESLSRLGTPEDRTQLVFVQDAVNFCFWAEKGKPRWQIEWPEGTLMEGGWFNLEAALERAIAGGVALADAAYLAALPLPETRAMFAGANGVDIPMLDERHKHLVEAGTVLLERYDGRFERALEKTSNDSITLVHEVVAHFPSFNDVARYRGNDVVFHKRAQILASDLALIGVPMRRLDELTAFADYKLPQMLREFGIIGYDEKLAKMVDSETLIPAGSEEEIEIRAATIWGVELLRQGLRDFSAAQIDFGLWMLSQDRSLASHPHHRTYSRFY